MEELQKHDFWYYNNSFMSAQWKTSRNMTFNSFMSAQRKSSRNMTFNSFISAQWKSFGEHATSL